jgi:hypothetical protein
LIANEVKPNGEADATEESKAMPSFNLTAPALLIMALTYPAAAGAIECDRQFQIVNGQRISTPYCSDQFLGQVARERGMNVTDENVRQSASLKSDICRSIGHDNRLRTICTNYFPNPGSND